MLFALSCRLALVGRRFNIVQRISQTQLLGTYVSWVVDVAACAWRGPAAVVVVVVVVVAGCVVAVVVAEHTRVSI